MCDYLIIAADYKPNPGGIAAYLDNLARGLRALKHETTVLALVDGADTARIGFLKHYADWVVPFEVAYDARPTNRFGAKLVSLLEVLRCSGPLLQRLLDRTPFFTASHESALRFDQILKREKPRMVVFGHLELRFYTFALWLLRQGVPYGVIAHDSEVYRHSDRPNDLFRRGMMLKSAAWIAANSHHTKSLLQQWKIPDDRLMIVHPPLPAEVRGADDTRKRPDLDGAYVLVTVCRLVKGKGIDVVLHSLKTLDQSRIPYKYIIVGDGPERGRLERLAVELGVDKRVHFAGYVSEEEKYRYLRSADVFVMTSRVTPQEQHEGFGLAFIEAASCGIPSVGTRAGGIPEAVIDCETGILVEPDSPHELAAALAFLYHHPDQRRKMGEAGMMRAEREFAPGVVAAHFRSEVARRMTTTGQGAGPATALGRVWRALL